jgi:Ala-tRNA(Pro) deacylase
MTSPTITQYLTRQGAPYDVLAHEPTQSSTRTAQACHVSGDRFAKAVVLHDGGGFLVAVLPASHHLRLTELEGNASLRMASEDEIGQLFPDCARGAVPPIAAAYGLKTIVDDSIAAMPEVYFEGGDHATLVHMSGAAFSRLLADAPHARISTHD